MSPYIAFSQIYGGLHVRGIGVTSDGTPYYVWGGSVDYLRPSGPVEPNQGLLIFEPQPKNACDPATIDENGPGNDEMFTYETPERAGPIVHLSGLGDSVEVVTSTGMKFTFSVTKRAFVGNT